MRFSSSLHYKAKEVCWSDTSLISNQAPASQITLTVISANTSQHASSYQRESESGKAKSTQMHIKLHQIQLIWLQNSVQRYSLVTQRLRSLGWGWRVCLVASVLSYIISLIMAQAQALRGVTSGPGSPHGPLLIIISTETVAKVSAYRQIKL